ncbi:acyl-CoA dehydrogenase family protein [Gammaproteobacteria bacterium]|jgi:alkylation response protein AidB-like acyl-CoA dehydrogenase|nr:acyl-CoA dehydrogenase family protein [Gammaproteobacteria bacterium]
MNFNFTKEEEQFIDEVKSFIDEEKKKPNADDVFAPNREADAQTKIDSPARRDFMKILSSKGYLGMSWPKEYGGQEKPGIYDYILNEELCRVGAPSPGKGVGSIGQTIIHHGSNKIKDEFLPKILAGEIDFALGYSEPGAGSDLASLQLKAEKKNGGWLINGQKIWTSSAHVADWYWLAARTDPEAPKHKGISVFLVKMDNPGIEVHPIETVGEHATNSVFLTDVFIPDEYVVGEINLGWVYICEALNYERFTFYTIAPLEQKFKELVELTNKVKRDGVLLSEIPDIRKKIIYLFADVQKAKVLQRKVLSVALQDEVPQTEAAVFKLFSTKLHQKLANQAMDILGREGLFRKEYDKSHANGKWEWSYRSTLVDTIGAGTTEIQKNTIAKKSLKLPL